MSTAVSPSRSRVFRILATHCVIAAATASTALQLALDAPYVLCSPGDSLSAMMRT
jgi:hypothetical protein